jgi:nucleoside-diphosphate-sugar epimerase
MKTILVVGGAGFIGSHLCAQLLKDNRNVVYAVDNLITGNVCNLDELFNHRRFNFVNLDASHHKTSKELADTHKIRSVDEIYYLASIASPKLYLMMPMQTIKANIHGLINFLEIAHKHRSRFLYTSTSEVYGDPEIATQHEDYTGNVDPVADRSIYDETKRAGETIVTAYNRSRGVNTRIVRIFNTYGPHMSKQDGRVIPTFIDQALTGNDFTVFGDGQQTRSFCYVTDTVDALIKVMKSSCVAPLNVGNSREYYTMLDVATMVKRLVSNCESQIIFRPFISENDPKLRRPNITKISRIAKWQPKIKLESGLSIMIQHFQATT